MTELEILSIIFGIMGVISTILFAILAYNRNKTHDDTKEGHKVGAVLTELGYIKSGVDDIKRKQEKQDEQHIEVISRLSVLEESTREAHKRIDYLTHEYETK